MRPANRLNWREIVVFAAIALVAVLAFVGSALVGQPRWASLDGIRSVHGQPVSASGSVIDSQLAQSTAAGLLGRSSVVMRGRVDLDGSSVPAVSLATLDPPAASGFDLLRGAWPATDNEAAITPLLSDLYGLDIGTTVAVAGQQRLLTGVVEDRNQTGTVEVVTTSQVLYAAGDVNQLVVLSERELDDLRFAGQGVAGARVPWTTATAVRSGPQRSAGLQLVLASAALVALAVLAEGGRRYSARGNEWWRGGRDGAVAAGIGFAGASLFVTATLSAVEGSLHRRLHWTAGPAMTIGFAVLLAALLTVLLALNRRWARGRSVVPVVLLCATAIVLMLVFTSAESQPFGEPFNRNSDPALGRDLTPNTVLIGDQADLTEFAGTVDLSALQTRVAAALPVDDFAVVGMTIAAGEGSGAFVTAQSTRAASPLGLATAALFDALGCEIARGRPGQLAAWTGVDLDPQGYVVRGEHVAVDNIARLDCAALASPLIPDLWTFDDSRGSVTAGVVVSAHDDLQSDDVTRLGLLTHPIALNTKEAGEPRAQMVVRRVGWVALAGLLALTIAWSLSSAVRRRSLALD